MQFHEYCGYTNWKSFNLCICNIPTVDDMDNGHNVLTFISWLIFLQGKTHFLIVSGYAFDQI